MASTRINVLVYTGNGTTVESVRHCVWSLRRLLSPNYAVIPVDGQTILKEPWTASCALLVIPGGADLGYCRTLNGEGNRRIRQYVERGGAYLGFCAGGYYGSKRCEFEAGNKRLEVLGDRELAFYPDTCRGCAYAGFVYHSEAGARAVELRVEEQAFKGPSIPQVFKSYYNGGGVFVNAKKYRDQGVEVLAHYTDETSVDGGDGAAAVVYCKVGEGGVLLTGPHPEFAPVNLNKNADPSTFAQVVEELEKDDKLRIDFLKACLLKLGLQVSQEDGTIPSLSRLHLSASEPISVSSILESWKDIIVTEEGEELIKGENDTFKLEKSSTWSLESVAQALPGEQNKLASGSKAEGEQFIDYNTVIKRIVPHDQDSPSSKETPYFNHNAFFANLLRYRSTSRLPEPAWGSPLLYGEVVTSTNTILEKNNSLLQRLPSGFTATATVQVAGRGRGANVWVSPAGSLMFSTVIRHSLEAGTTAPVVFVQYLAAMSVVEAVNSYDKGYRDIPIKLKWPNDIYALDPKKPGEKSYVKIGGILVNSSYSGKEYMLVVGIGLNTTNAAPTTSLNALHPPHLPPFTLEKLLARILTVFEDMYMGFLRTGFSRELEDLYYRHWLHTDQIVTLESSGGVRARIKGITRDYGLLLAEELGWEDRSTGKIWQLQSDSNSFDFLKGLVKRKV